MYHDLYTQVPFLHMSLYRFITFLSLKHQNTISINTLILGYHWWITSDYHNAEKYTIPTCGHAHVQPHAHTV